MPKVEPTTSFEIFPAIKHTKLLKTIQLFFTLEAKRF